MEESFRRLRAIKKLTSFAATLSGVASDAVFESTATWHGKSCRSCLGGRRGRRRRRRTAACALEGCCATAPGHLRTGGIAKPVRKLPQSKAGRRLRASVDATNCENPLSFAGDVRGRFRQRLNGIYGARGVHKDLKSLASMFSYRGDSPSAPFVASRLGIPDKSAVAVISPWLSEATLEGWNHSVFQDGDDIKGYSQVPLREWKAATRNMLRSGLVAVVDANLGDPHSSAGAFAVEKDAHKDRLVADRRPRNAKERVCGPVRLPRAPQLRRIVFEPNQNIRIGKHDLSNVFYRIAADDVRRLKQLVGPRIPHSWFDDLDSTELDNVVPHDSWYVRDICTHAAGLLTKLTIQSICQLAAKAVLMGADPLLLQSRKLTRGSSCERASLRALRCWVVPGLE